MVYERIRNLREDADLTQQQVADKLFINRRTYSSYENGIRGIPSEVLGNIADIFNTSVDYLMSRTDTKKPYPKSFKNRMNREN
ncbi:MAG: helix-turn-helix domain-containing protein [Oscillospiraceae bacterium]|nr:helix-turn-helix domain-containing protein [Oscillospiraceae bacterium]MDE6131978.1 helix-turn-helix domain-containing protein [Oscillospiraceae bacterium]